MPCMSRNWEWKWRDFNKSLSEAIREIPNQQAMPSYWRKDMSDPKMLKIRGKPCGKRYLSDTQGRCEHPEKKYAKCVTALRRGKCPIDSGWHTVNKDGMKAGVREP